jgi:hypothetical protein
MWTKGQLFLAKSTQKADMTVCTAHVRFRG